MKIGILVDASFSMQKRKQQTVDGFAEYLNGLSQGKTKGKRILLRTFNGKDGALTIDRFVKPKKCVGLTPINYKPAGLTPLFDAVVDMINDLSEAADESEKVVMVIMTDGEENYSVQHKDPKALSEMIESKKAGGNWTVLYLGADFDAWKGQDSMGLSAASQGNSMSYDTRDTKRVMRTMAAGTISLEGSERGATESFWKDAQESEQAKGKKS